jgi:hypothetical protein
MAMNWGYQYHKLQFVSSSVATLIMLGDDHTRHFCANYGGSARKQFLNFGGPAPQNGAFQWLHGLVMSTTSISTNLLAPLAELNLLPAA